MSSEYLRRRLRSFRTCCPTYVDEPHHAECVERRPPGSITKPGADE